MCAVCDIHGVAGVTRSHLATFQDGLGTRFLKYGACLVLVGGGLFMGRTAVGVSLPAVTALALMVALGLAISPLIGFRGVPIAGLLFSLPLPIAKHVTYLPNHIGSSDGIVIEFIDIWLFWMLAQYAYLRRMGHAERVRGLGAFCVPLVLLLLADVLSFRNSSDVVLGVYGLLSDLRVAFLFIMLTVVLSQGYEEERAALTGIMWSMLLVGTICVLQMVLGVNFGRPEDPFEGLYGAFRAAGTGTATTTASYLAILLPLVIVEVVQADTRSRKQFAFAALVMGLLGLGCTMTRAAIGFLLIGSVPLCIFLLRERVLRIRHLFLACVAVAALAAALSDKIAERSEEGTNNMTARIGLVGTALNMAADSPLTGQGVNNYWEKMGTFTPKLQINPFEYVVHNKFLLTLAETGAMGLLAFVWFLLVAFARSLSLARRRPLVGLGLFSALIVATLDMNMEVFASGFPLLAVFTVAAFVAALSSADRASEDAVAS